MAARHEPFEDEGLVLDLKQANRARRAFWRVGGILLLVVSAHEIMTTLFFNDPVPGAHEIPQPPGPLLLVRAVVVAVIGWAMLRASLVKRPRVVLTANHVEIHHLGVWDESLSIPRHTLRSALLHSNRNSPSGPRFPVDCLDDDGKPTGELFHLYDNDLPGLLPSVSTAEDVPNLALLFDRTLVLPRATRSVKTFYRSRATTRPPVSGERVGGLLLNVKRPEVAAAAFASWGVLAGCAEPEPAGPQASPSAAA